MKYTSDEHTEIRQYIVACAWDYQTVGNLLLIRNRIQER
jgi:hypothetical protein